MSYQVKQGSNQVAPPTQEEINDMLSASWQRIAPFWPLKSLVAVNPVAGFQHLAFDEALKQAGYYFQAKDLPEPMQQINRISIKWLQAYFDEGQSVFKIPNREKGLLGCIRELLFFDDDLSVSKPEKRRWLRDLPAKPIDVIASCLRYLSIHRERSQEFLLLMLTTLSGWSSHVCYLADWAQGSQSCLKNEYVALRLVIACLVWPQASRLLVWQEKNKRKQDAANTLRPFVTDLERAEAAFQAGFMRELKLKGQLALQHGRKLPDAQWVFCIDVRSEPFRRSLEKQGNYETFGFAGFFGVPIAVSQGDKSQSSCPVLLQPEHHVCQHEVVENRRQQKRRHAALRLKKTYQSTKYNFTTPFALIEVAGLCFGLRMLAKSFFPKLVSAFKNWLGLSKPPLKSVAVDLSHIPLEKQVAYAQGMLKAIGLTTHFSPLVVLTGHGSQTDNNAHGTLLDCGACAGRSGGINAKVQAAILNKPEVRSSLKALGIVIPKKTWFCAAEHNTTTDEVLLDKGCIPPQYHSQVQQLERHLRHARNYNNELRSQHMQGTKEGQAKTSLAQLAEDWSSVRPEWGLARNAGFVVAPRWLTAGMDLQGRSFLHSYDWEQDKEAAILRAILTAPMVVGHWINSQYLFSTWDNVAFGGGNKITANITGKIGMVQGNASDLMPGLSLQSVYQDDKQAFHDPARLTTIIYATFDQVERAVKQESVLRELVDNGWVHMMVIDPESKQVMWLLPDLSWAFVGCLNDLENTV